MVKVCAVLPAVSWCGFWTQVPAGLWPGRREVPAGSQEDVTSHWLAVLGSPGGCLWIDAPSPLFCGSSHCPHRRCLASQARASRWALTGFPSCSEGRRRRDPAHSWGFHAKSAGPTGRGAGALHHLCLMDGRPSSLRSCQSASKNWRLVFLVATQPHTELFSASPASQAPENQLLFQTSAFLRFVPAPFCSGLRERAREERCCLPRGDHMTETHGMPPQALG